MDARMMQQFNEKTEKWRAFLCAVLGPDKALEVMRKNREESERREHERKMLLAVSTQPTPVVIAPFPWLWIVIAFTIYAALLGAYFAR